MPSLGTAPYSLVAVCRFWRAVGVATPRLWSYLTLDIDTECPEGYYESMAAWLSRSGNCALSLDFTFPNDDRTPADVQLHPVFQLAVRHSHRWEEVQIHSDFSEPSLHSFACIKGKIPLLQSLTVILAYEHNMRGGADGFVDAPRLRQYYLHDCESKMEVLKVPWGSLTKLNLQTFDGDDKSLLLLSQCRQVVELEIMVCNPWGGNAMDIDAARAIEFELPHLKSLTLESDDPISRLFLVLSAPALQHLHLTMCEYFQFDHWVAAENSSCYPLHLSKCRITSLRLDLRKPVNGPKDLILCLNQTPHLEHLVLEGTAVSLLSSELLQRLAPDSPTQLLPKLQTLTMDHIEDFPDALVAEILGQRLSSSSKGPSLLRSVVLKHCDTMTGVKSWRYRSSPLTLACLRLHSQRGLDIRLLDFRGKRIKM
ncbi:hypothetical protein HWV62_11157 [Athelia sp. TMB]|nr:hypothetical protein HWV62_11157 [Athelia sp. TMB]